MKLQGPDGAGAAQDAGQVKENRVLKEKCRDLEAVFLGYLLKTMRQSMVDAEDGDNAKGIYEGMGDQALAKALSESESLGIAKLLYQDLSRRGPEQNP